MNGTPPASALAALPDDDFAVLVRASIGREADTAVWDALTDPAVIARTKVALAAIHSDVENQLSLAGATLQAVTGGREAYFGAKAAQAEWRRKALGFRRLVQLRIALVKQRTPRPANQPSGSGIARRRYAEALEKLARAVAAHRDRVLSGDGSEDDDDDLWDFLDEITVPDGKSGEQSVADWLAYLDKIREGDDE